MFKIISLLFLVAYTGTALGMEEGNAVPPWQDFADCAAGYYGNVKSRETDPDRGPEMSNMVQEIAEEYEAAAIEAFDNTLTNMEPPRDTVRTYIERNIERFVAMDERGELNTFLEECPQTY